MRFFLLAAFHHWHADYRTAALYFNTSRTWESLPGRRTGHHRYNVREFDYCREESHGDLEVDHVPSNRQGVPIR